MFNVLALTTLTVPLLLKLLALIVSTSPLLTLIRPLLTKAPPLMVKPPPLRMAPMVPWLTRLSPAWDEAFSVGQMTCLHNADE